MGTDSNNRRRTLLLLVLLALLPYLNALSASFTLDDQEQIRNNPAVTGGVNVMRALTTPLAPGDLYRPLTVLTFAVNEVLMPGVPAPFHAVNMLLHGIVTVLVFALAMRLLQSARVAVIAAGLFALHPIHTEAVTSIVGRAELLAALFGLVALLSAAWADETVSRPLGLILLGVSLISFSLALLSKESALTFLGLIPLARIALRGESLTRGLRREFRSLDWVPYVLCAGIFVLLRFYILGTVTPNTVRPLDNALAFVPAAVRVRSAVGVLWDYFGLLNVPLVLAADYSYRQVPVIASWSDPRFIAGALLLMGAGLVVARHPRPGVKFAAAFPFIAISLTANVLFPIGTIKAERLLYLPSVGWALLAGYAFDRLLENGKYHRAAALGLMAMVAAFGARTWMRNWDWQDNVALGQSMVWTAPGSAKSRYNFAVGLQGQADAAAMAEFRRALAIYPWMEDAAVGIGLILERKGRPDKAVEWYEKALRIVPALGQAHTSLCHALLVERRFQDAARACRDGLRYRPADANLLVGLGHSLIGMGAIDKGVDILRRSLALNRENQELRTYLARLETAERPDHERITVQ